jgi:hypothetical protein
VSNIIHYFSRSHSRCITELLIDKKQSIKLVQGMVLLFYGYEEQKSENISPCGT